MSVQKFYMSNDKMPKQLDVLARHGLRFRILCEYYIMFHKRESPLQPGKKPKYKISGVNQSEVSAAEEYLIERRFLNGKAHHFSSESVMMISSISYSGIDLVEMAALKSENTELNEAVSEKSIEKTEGFVNKCFNHPAANSICKATVDIIAHLFRSM